MQVNQGSFNQLKTISIHLQYQLVIVATTDMNATLTEFKVFEGETELALKDDGKTTVKQFPYGSIIPSIKVTKIGYTDKTEENIVIVAGENNIEVNLPSKTKVKG